MDIYLLRESLKPYLTWLPGCKSGKEKCVCGPEADCPWQIGKQDAKIPFHFERAVDDFILLVALLGNDFLPALPLPDFDIHTGAINEVVKIWKKVAKVHGYIVKDGIIRLDRLRRLFKALAEKEDFQETQAGELCDCMSRRRDEDGPRISTQTNLPALLPYLSAYLRLSDRKTLQGRIRAAQRIGHTVPDGVLCFQKLRLQSCCGHASPLRSF